MYTNSAYLKAVDERAERATPGPWVEYTINMILAAAARAGFVMNKEDAPFIAAARTDVEVLSSRVKELEAALALAVQLLPQSEEWAYLDAILAAKPPGDEK